MGITIRKLTVLLKDKMMFEHGALQQEGPHTCVLFLRVPTQQRGGSSVGMVEQERARNPKSLYVGK